MFLLRQGKCLPPLFRPLAASVRTLFIPPGEETPSLTMEELLENFYGVLGTTSRSYSGAQDTDHRRQLMELLPKDRSELPPRTMRDSFLSAVIPLKTNAGLRDRYINVHGRARIGRLFEDLDIFAGTCCYKHILNPKSEGKPNPYSCVTALVDSIEFSSADIRPDEDIRLTGHVSYVGRSSLEISILVDQRNQEGLWKQITDALFVFVARDPMNRGAAMVNPLVGETEEEKKFILAGEERNRKRKTASEASLSKKPPSPEEIEIVHKFFAGNCAFSTPKRLVLPNTEQMSDWEINTLLLCHPQYRNRFNKIFGGFIMRQAFEIAHSTVYLYSRALPKIVYIDDILFRKPVEIGSLLRFNASVSYVEGRFVHVPVVAEVLKPETNEQSVTNVFQFTFETRSQVSPPLVLPNTYVEAMRYLNARRHFQVSGMSKEGTSV